MAAIHKFGTYGTKAKYAITLARYGCSNRPFFHVVVAKRKTRRWEGDVIEQIGSFDPIPNRFSEKLIALNFDRLKYWLGQDETGVSVPVLELLGYCGLLPVHPCTYIRARKTRMFLEEYENSVKAQLSAKAGTKEDESEQEAKKV